MHRYHVGDEATGGVQTHRFLETNGLAVKLNWKNINDRGMQNGNLVMQLAPYYHNKKKKVHNRSYRF